MKTLYTLFLFLTVTFISAAHITEIADFWDIKYKNRPIIIEGYATWCAPCRVYAPVFERLASEYSGKADFYRINVENSEAGDFNSNFNVQSVPVTVFMWDAAGDVTMLNTVEFGLMGYDELKRHIDTAIAKQYRPEKQNTQRGKELEHVRAEGTWPYIPKLAKFPWVYKSYLNPYIGEWIGTENGCESKITFTRSDNQVIMIPGTLERHRMDIYGTPYWYISSCTWDYDKVRIIDLVADRPSDYDDSSLNQGIFYERYLTVDGDTMTMEVKQFNDWNSFNNNLPDRTYTITYHKLKNN